MGNLETEGWAVRQTLNIEGIKIENFPCLGMGCYTSMGSSWSFTVVRRMHDKCRYMEFNINAMANSVVVCSELIA